jgi:acetoacetyl-CoA reductase/3-oxoacyl-[acyl-carrier protein] reductase
VNARGRVALVTGGTRGLGAAISTRLVEDGAIVAAAYRSDDDAAKELRATLGPDRITIHAVDLHTADACRALATEVVETHGAIDLLVNNAGALVERRFTEIDPPMFDQSWRANVSPAFYLTQAVIPAMRELRFGRIVNIGSVSASMGSAYQVDYATAKAALVGLTRSVARAVARHGITVNCVVPGGFATDMLDAMSLTDRSAVERSIPIGRYGRPRELAHVVASLLHDDASYVTGAIVAVDGGLGMGA